MIYLAECLEKIECALADHHGVTDFTFAVHVDSSMFRIRIIWSPRPMLKPDTCKQMSIQMAVNRADARQSVIDYIGLMIEKMVRELEKPCQT